MSRQRQGAQGRRGPAHTLLVGLPGPRAPTSCARPASPTPPPQRRALLPEAPQLWSRGAIPRPEHRVGKGPGSGKVKSLKLQVTEDAGRRQAEIQWEGAQSFYRCQRESWPPAGGARMTDTIAPAAWRTRGGAWPHSLRSVTPHGPAGHTAARPPPLWFS